MLISVHILQYFLRLCLPFRTEIEGTAYYFATDVCRLLQFEVPEEDGAHYAFNGQWRLDYNHVIVVNESGLYSLLIRSPLEEAQLFRQWITEAVLPAIRHDGGYFDGEPALVGKKARKLGSEVPVTGRRWLTDIVLPSIQRDGNYIDGQEKFQDGRITRVDFRQLVTAVVKQKAELAT